MLDSRIRRLLDAYPAIFLACHRKHLREDESGNKITDQQASVLDHLHATRPTTLSKLAEHMGVSRSTMSITVVRLIRRGYIARQHDTKDLRRVALTLTAAGERIKEHNTLLDPALVQEMFSFMSTAELEVALRGIERLAVSAGALLRRRNRGGAR